MYSIVAKNTLIFDALIAHADISLNAVDQCKQTALHYAVQSRSLYFVWRLVQKDASLSIKNAENKTPIQLANTVISSFLTQFMEFKRRELRLKFYTF